MAGLLQMASRNLSRPAIRIINFSLERNFSEVPNNRRSFHHIARQLRKACVRENNSTVSRPKDALHAHLIRYLSTSPVLKDSKVVSVPTFPDSVSEGDVKLDKKIGDSVGIDEVVMEIETDKTALPVTSPINGVIEEIFVKNGETVKYGKELFKVKLSTGAPAPKAPAADAPKPQAAAPAPPKPTAPPAAAAPSPVAAPRPAAQVPAKPVASIPVAAIRHAQSLEAATVKVPPSDPTKEITGTRSEQRVKMNRMRLKIAERLKLAQNVNAMLTTFNEVDMSHIMEFRKSNLDSFIKKYGIKLGFMSAFIKASAYALQDQPIVNAVIDGQDIIYRDYIDISVAVATPRGLVVPVVRNVETMNFADIEINIAALGEKARKGKLAIEDMDGGTFTISNGGVFGSLLGTPIINPPQSSILGMHGIFDRPIAMKGQVVIRPMMYVALTYDHRLIDGRDAVMFLKKIKSAVEDPRIIIAGL